MPQWPRPHFVRPKQTDPNTFDAGDVTRLAIEDKYEDDIEKLIDTGKEKGYLTFGEVNDLLPGDISRPTSSMT